MNGINAQALTKTREDENFFRWRLEMPLLPANYPVAGEAPPEQQTPLRLRKKNNSPVICRDRQLSRERFLAAETRPVLGLSRGAVNRSLFYESISQTHLMTLVGNSSKAATVGSGSCVSR